MREYLLPAGGQFYKANLHAHSTISDGAATPEEIRDAYRAAGYSVVAFTDHEVMVDHSELSGPDFLALRGYEIRVDDRTDRYETRKTYHIGLIARSPDITHQVFFNPRGHFTKNAAAYASSVLCREPVYQYTYSPMFINRLLRAARAEGFLPIYNHPHWSLHTEEDYLPLEGLFGIEVVNATCSALRASADTGSDIYERMLRAGKTSLIPLATDDNHNADGFSGPKSDSFIAFTMIKAPSLRYGDIIEALESGDCYASAGPLIHALFRDGETLTVETSPVREILLLTDGRDGIRRTDVRPLTGASFRIPDGCAWFRLEMADEAGRRAFTRAYPTAL